MSDIDGPSGFWSYVHKDDDQGGQRITRLASLLQDEYSLLTGHDLELFLDRNSLSWGDEWRLRINDALQDTTFFIPIVTPRYFTSNECRKELLKFATYARSLGADELLLPILYVQVSDLDETNSDEAKALIASRQYEDWTDLRLTDESSEGYARAVNKLASRLAEISDEYSSKPSVVPAEDTLHESLDGEVEPEAGLSDLVASLEEDFPLWTEAIEGFPEILTRIHDITVGATENFNDVKTDSFAKRVLIAREMAAEMDPPAEDLLQQGAKYASLLLAVDPGVRALIAIAEEQEEPEDIRTSCEMFGSLRELIEASHENESVLRDFIQQLKGPSRQFRDLRPPLEKMEAGMRSVLDAQTIMNEWVRLMDESPLDCSAHSTS